jgi:hypothetical protein
VARACEGMEEETVKIGKCNTKFKLRKLYIFQKTKIPPTCEVGSV